MNKRHKEQLDFICYVMGITDKDKNKIKLVYEIMLSEGIVSSCELRGQLCEYFPCAYREGAKALGCTLEGLQGLLEEGEIDSYEFFDCLFCHLEKRLHEQFENKL